MKKFRTHVAKETVTNVNQSTNVDGNENSRSQARDLWSLATGAGSPQEREPITVGPYYLSHPVNSPCGREPEYPEKTHDFRQSVDYTLFTWVKSILLGIELGTLEVKGEWSDHYTTEAPYIYIRMTKTQ